ncbi:uncharacterized protein LOC124458338 [Xenia sp. Carnegie-2017]|uniref:uncharacterized protein LOC124435200 n=1 Tax=Xenia sp. Carnegie-2017 TaxID=2897299 RepID=UPI001F04CB86|nr:uncharacterized protein LOC124435200 [Xenia sp. Carnegie-2017]XP_046864328.1 uncharacterized protein LOC124458338 [Xenia sp. Carnegie-2017]
MAMIKHAMKTVKESTKFLNPNQTPVIAMDQPLYALAKQIQWNNKNEFGEDKYMVMMGGLHIEMAILKMIGHWLTNSGWASALIHAEVMTSGRADSVLKGSHVTRSRYVHQVSACAIYLMQKIAYQEYIESCEDKPQKL